VLLKRLQNKGSSAWRYFVKCRNIQIKIT